MAAIAPSVSGLSPSSAIAGGAGFSLTVNGTEFVNGFVIRVNGLDRTTAFVDSTQLSTVIDAPEIGAAGSFSVTVLDPNPSGGESAPLTFTIANPVPIADSLSPTTITAGAPAFTLTVNGSNFVSGATVHFGGADHAGTVNAGGTQVTATIDAPEIMNGSTVAVRVSNPSPGGGASTPDLNFTVNNPLPTISNLSPASANAGSGGFTLAIDGSNFVSGATVWFGATEHAGTVNGAGTQVTTTVAASEILTGGNIAVTVTNPSPGGGASTPALTFAVNNPPPIANSLSPAIATAGTGGFTLAIDGSNFVSGATVHFGATEHAGTVNAGGTQVTAAIAASEILTGNTIAVTVSNPVPGGGASTPALTFTLNNPLPIASSLSPTIATAGSGAFTLTVNGSNFVVGSTVNFQGISHTATFVNSTQLTAQIAASEFATGGTASVTVTNPTPGGGTSTPPLIVTVNNPVPTVSSLSPTTKFAGDTAFGLTVNGTNFNSSSAVRFNGSARTTTFVSTTQLTASILATDIVAVGTFPVTVLNPTPAGGTSGPVNFSVTTVPVPTITTLSPTSVFAGGTNFTLTVNGINFFPGSVVRFNASSRSTTFVSSTKLTASITAVDIANAGVFPITVFNPAPGGGTSAVSNLTVNPFISSASPTIVRAGGIGFTLTVNGVGFVSGSKIRWNASSKSTTFVNSTRLTASISSSDIATVGIVPVTVLNPAPSNLTSNASNVTVTPSITNLAPLTAVAGDPGFSLTVTGTGFVMGAVVNWNGLNRPTTFVNSTKLTASIPATDIAAIGVFAITVANPAPNNLASNPFNFNVTDATPASECPAVANNLLTNPGLINFGPEKSQMWRNDNTWWGAFSNNTDGIYFYKQTGGSFTQGPLIDSNFVAGAFIAGSPDCLWNGTNVFILIQESTILAKLYKYSYSSANQTYALTPGFPLNLPLTGAGTNTSGKFGAISFDQDSTGKLWAAYAGGGVGGDGKVHVIWSTSADHRTWDTTGFVLATGTSTSTQEGAPIIHFGNNKIGVVWSNQTVSESGFRYHTDGDAETIWSAKEIIDSGLGPQGLGSAVDNHMSIKAAPDGRLFLVAKDNDGNGHLHLFIRSAAGVWGQKTLVVNDFNASPTRPVLLLDTDNNEVHVIYKDASATGVSRTFITQSFMNNPAFNTPCIFLDTSQSTQTSSNPTSTKQNLNASTDLMVAASTGKKGNTILFNAIDITPNQVTIFDLSPREVTAGESLANLTLTINGKLFVKTPTPGSIVQVNGLDRVTTYFNAGKMTASIPGTDLLTPGVLPVTITNPDGSVSNTANFTITATNPIPSVSSIAPGREPVGSTPFTLTVTGTGFRRTSLVQFNGGNRATTFVSDTQLQATILATDLLGSGAYPITVLNPAPGGGTSAVSRFSTFFVQPPCPTSSPQNFGGITVFNTVKSQMWYNDGLWWGTLSDNSGGIYFYKQSGASFTKGALIDGNFNGRPDVKWNGTNLFVLIYELNTQAKLYKFGYNSTTKIYSLLTGFPVSLPLVGVGTGATPSQTGSITIEQDSTGKLWAAYPGTGPGGDGNIRVIWSTSADHKTWDTTGFVLASGASTTAQEVAPIVRFGSNKIGVAWSNQVAKELAFRYHLDGDTETTWSTKEVIDFGLGNEIGIGGVADNHVSMKATPDGRIFLVAKDSDGVGYLHLYIRSAAGLWSDAPTLIDPDPQAQNVRPTLLLDLENSEVYVIYENLGSSLMYLNHTSMDVPVFGPACPYVSQTFIANITSTKQNLNANMGLMAAGSTGGPSSSIYLNAVTLTHGTGNPLPTLTGISPSGVAVGGGPFTLTLSGSNFVNGAVVYFSGSDRPTTFVSSTQLTATILASDIAAVGAFPVTVMNPRGGASAAVNLKVNPLISGLAPANATVGGPAFTLTVNGMGFVSGATVNFNGAARTAVFVNATQLTAQITAADIQTAAILPVTVVNPATGGASAPANFTVTNRVPTVASMTPSRTSVGGGAFTLTVTGANFVNTSAVRWNGAARATTFVSSTQLTAQILASDLLVPGAYPITVFNLAPGGGTSAVTKSSTFFVQPSCAPSAPEIFSGGTLFNTVKSQMWYNDGLWWGAFSDNSGGIYFHRQEGATFSKDALIDPNVNGLPDVKWNGTNLFVLVFELNTQAKLYKYGYDSATRTYTLLVDFPVTLPLIGVGSGATQALTGSITIEQDSTGKLWAAYPGTGPGGDGNIRVIWSTSADHKTWDTTGFVLASAASTTAQEVAPVIHFGGNKIGLAWSNQVAKEIAFRYHNDGTAESNWSPKEVVDFGLGNEVGIGGVADNHMSIKAAPDGRVFLVAKDSDGVGYLHLYIRSTAGLWSDPPTLIDPDPQAQSVRPTLLLDLENSEVYVIYENLGSSLMYLNHTSMDVPVFGPACPYVSQTSIANITSTKQNLNANMGLMAAGSTGGASSSIYLNAVTLAPGTGNPLPTLTGISPSGVAVGGGPFTLTLSGSNFVNGAVVYFSGSDRPTTFVSSTQLTATILASDIAGIGSLPIAVMNPRGGTSAAVNLTVNPAISGLSPASVTAGDSGFTLTVNGLGFVAGATVRFNGSDRATTFVNATQLTAEITTADIQSAGAFLITVANPTPGGGSSDAVGFTVLNPVPMIDALSPISVTAGSSAFTLTVSGSNFVPGSLVRFNGSDRVTTFVDAAHLTAEITAADAQLGGTFPIVVSNPTPGGGTASPISLTVENPLPLVSGLSPANAGAGEAGFTLTVNGSNFVIGAVVRFDGNARATTFIDNTRLIAQIVAADIATVGAHPVTVVNPAPGGGISNSLNLAVDIPLPTITAISPTNKTKGDVAFALSISGTGFVDGSVVRWNGSDRLTTFVGGTQLAAQVTAADIGNVGTSSVTVFNPAPGGGTSGAATFTINDNLRKVRIKPGSAAPGSTVSLPIELDAQGNENVLGFSISFDTSLLSNPQAILGSDANGATLSTDTTELAQGRFGISTSLPAGAVFTSGTRQIVVLTFTLASVVIPGTTQVNFANQPTPLGVVDPNNVNLLTDFTAGAVTITVGYEADVSPRPNGSNTGAIAISDWVECGRFSAGIDTPNPGSEFQRADTAPKATLGDGKITISDWVQCGRYASGQDPVVAAGGPTSAPVVPVAESQTAEKSSTAERETAVSTRVRLVDTALPTGRNRSLSLEVDAQGNENALGFSLMFDPTKLSFVSAEKSDEFSIATINVNKLEAANGRVGIALALPTGRSFGVGTHQVVVVAFAAQADLSETMLIGFSDNPVNREVVDVNAKSVKGLFLDSREGMNPIEGAQFFVAQHYLDFLNRTADGGGLDYWTHQITQCGSDAACISQRRIAVSAAFFMEPEFQQTGYTVYRLYQAAYRQRPSYAQFMADSRQLVGGPQLAASRAEFASQFVRRAAFQQAYPASLTADDFVNRLYDTAGLPLTLTARRQAIEGITSKKKSRAQVLLDLIETKAFQEREYNSAFVLMQYFGYLRRDPDQDGYDFWVNVLNNKEPGNYRGMVCSFITSREYQERFSSLVTRSNQDCGP